MLEAVFFVMGAGLIAYVLTGGADFGGGFWHLVARGPRRDAQRTAIEHAIAPIWEANHVWLIFVIVMMFTAFPRAFAVMSIALHVPIAIALVGIVLRGAAFVFKAYGLEPRATRARWGIVFAGASVATPVFLGMVLAGASSGMIRVDGSRVLSGYFAGWTSGFAILTGLFALALFALLAATYLTVETEGEVREDFRRRALVAEGVAGLLALAVFLSAATSAPLLRARLEEVTFFWPLQIATAIAALVTVGCLVLRRFRVARVAVATQVTLVIVGWGAAMRGDLVLGVLGADSSGGRPATVRVVLPIVFAGTAVLLPALFYLFRVFKTAGARPDASD